MPGTAPLTFGGMPNGYNHAPRHIPVRDLDAPRRKPEQLTGYMVDPRYLKHDEKPAAGAVPLTTPRAVPALTPLEAAHNRAVREYRQSASQDQAGLIWPRDWRRVVAPIAVMLFIVGLGVANEIVRTTNPPAPERTLTQGSNKDQTATAPSPSPSPAANGSSSTSTSPTTSPNTSGQTQIVGGRGGGDTSSAVNPQATAAPTPSPSVQSTSGSTQQTTNQSSGTSGQATASTPIGGMGGGDGSNVSIAPEPGLPVPPVNLLPGK